MSTDVTTRRGSFHATPPGSLFLGTAAMSAFQRAPKDESAGSTPCEKVGRPLDDAPAPPPRRTPPQRPCSDR